MLQDGESAPRFELPDAEMAMVSLDFLLGKGYIILYFYIKDDSPCCTIESIAFSDLNDEFRRLGAVVIGISRDDCLSHCSFRDKHGLAVDLLSDPDGEVCRKYGVLAEKAFDGGVRHCVQRSTFIIDREGRVAKALYGVTAKGHAREILNLLKGMQ